MSNIPRARELLAIALANYTLPGGAEAAITKALRLMTREAPVSRSRAKVVDVTSAMKARIRRLSAAGFTQTEIARLVGLRNAGRVSEVLNGKR